MAARPGEGLLPLAPLQGHALGLSSVLRVNPSIATHSIATLQGRAPGPSVRPAKQRGMQERDAQERGTQREAQRKRERGREGGREG